VALPDYPTLVAGTPKTWASSGGDYALTLTSLADNAAREGAKGDFFDATFGLPEVLDVRFESAVASAATNGKQIELYLGESDHATAGTDNPGNLTGADAPLSNPDELKAQLYMVGGLNLSNARGTNVQKQRFSVIPTCRYQVPVAVNKSGQALHATAGNHKIVITPYYRKIQE
jgi:hypothetical protein